MPTGDQIFFQSAHLRTPASHQNSTTSFTPIQSWSVCFLSSTFPFPQCNTFLTLFDQTSPDLEGGGSFTSQLVFIHSIFWVAILRREPLSSRLPVLVDPALQALPNTASSQSPRRHFFFFTPEEDKNTQENTTSCFSPQRTRPLPRRPISGQLHQNSPFGGQAVSLFHPRLCRRPARCQLLEPNRYSPPHSVVRTRPYFFFNAACAHSFLP